MAEENDKDSTGYENCIEHGHRRKLRNSQVEAENEKPGEQKQATESSTTQ